MSQLEECKNLLKVLNYIHAKKNLIYVQRI